MGNRTASGGSLVWRFLFFAAFSFAFLYVCPARAQNVIPGTTIEKWDHFFFYPETMDKTTLRPVIVAFSPSADARGLMETWRDIARKFRCFLFASKVIRNGMDAPPVLKRITGELKSYSELFPMRFGAAICVGVSGGGMTSHLYSFFHPEAVGAVISTVGYIHEKTLKQKKIYPKGKVAVFLTGPTDFNYKLMKEDKNFLVSLGWNVRWREFEGGHTQAPGDILEESLAWVLEQPEFSRLLATPSPTLPTFEKKD